MTSQVAIHPHYGAALVRIHGRPYHWDGELYCYRRGYGPYSTTSTIGEWKPATNRQAADVLREIRS